MIPPLSSSIQCALGLVDFSHRTSTGVLCVSTFPHNGVHIHSLCAAEMPLPTVSIVMFSVPFFLPHASLLITVTTIPPPPPPPPPSLSGDIPIGSLPVTSPRILPQDGYNYIGKNETKESIPHGHPWPREKSRIANEQVLTLDPGQDKRKEEGRTQAGKQPTRKIREREGREGERELIGKHAESTKGQSPGHKTRPHHASPSAFLGGQREPPPSPRNLSSVQWWKECLHA